jgi:hypothetical protein
MSKHIDWSRITPRTIIWCQTDEEDLAFRQECEKRGMLWGTGERPTEFASKSIRTYITDMRHIALSLTDRYNQSIPYYDLLIEDKPAKSRLADILGVEDDEEWEHKGITNRIHDGRRQYKYKGTWCDGDAELRLLDIIETRERIIRKPKPRFTADELVALRCFSAVGASLRWY